MLNVDSDFHCVGSEISVINFLNNFSLILCIIQIFTTVRTCLQSWGKDYLHIGEGNFA